MWGRSTLYCRYGVELHYIVSVENGATLYCRYGVELHYIVGVGVELHYIVGVG